MRPNPFRVATKLQERTTIHKVLYDRIKRAKDLLQLDADKKYGKGKFYISFVYASKVLGEQR